MSSFLGNILLALTWTAMTGEFSGLNLLAGFALSYLILLFAQPVVGRSTYFLKVRQVAGFALFYLWELLQANLRVAHDVVTPTHRTRPGVVGVPLDTERDEVITILANLITMTPGTLSLDVSDDRKTLYVHAMYLDDPEALRRNIKQGFERRVVELFQ